MEKEPYEDPTCHEMFTDNLPAGIMIRNLNKEFSTVAGPKIAVNKLSMEMYEGQITALLGHNGAGKTTTINMLTGMYPPTKGDALVDGHSILNNMERIRESMGICPQHNVLFNMMTVEQHLDFFIRLKGEQDNATIKEEVESMLKKLKLQDKRSVIAKKLSGGMKRKLSVGIAMCGNSKVVILDEPTTGMDASARRELWDILLENKEGRTIVFTTHSMDEADLLGDRIAIMAAGKLVCSGSSLFLKRRFGVGYHLTLVKEAANMPQGAIDKITALIRGHVPSAACNSNVGSELSYLLSSDHIQHFVKLFQELEEDSAKYGITSFGVSLTTMEEVFMKAGEGHDSNVEAIKNKVEGSKKTIRKFSHSELNSGGALLWQQFKCQFRKRFIQAKRSKMLILAQIALPFFFMIIGLALSVGIKNAITSSRVLTLADYPNDKINAQLYFADLRVNEPGEYTDKVSSYLNDHMSVNVIDISEEVAALKGSYNGDTESCCTNSYLQLSAKCIEDLLPTKYEVCYDDKYKEAHFTYQACKSDCMSVCPAGQDCYAPFACSVNGRLPLVEDSQEETNYFQNYFMEMAANYTGNFYVDYQGGLTFSDTYDFYTIYDKDGNVVKNTTSDLSIVRDDYKGAKFTETEDILTAWVSYKGIHLMPALQTSMTNIIFKINNLTTRVEVENDPLPEELKKNSKPNVNQKDIFLISFYIIGVSFLIASFAASPVEERVNKSKHLQQISGVNPIVYWLGTMTWDYINYLASVLVVYILIMCFRVEGFQGERAGALFLLLMLEGLAVLPLVYILSHMFAKSTSAFGVIATFMFLITMVGYVLISVTLPEYESDALRSKDGKKNRYSWILTVEALFLIHPHFATCSAMGNLLTGYSREKKYKTCLESSSSVECNELGLNHTPIFDMKQGGVGIGRHVTALFVTGIFWLALLLVFETYWYKIRGQLSKLFSGQRLDHVSDKEDEMVKVERERVYQEREQLISSKGAVMVDLHKRFGKKVVVQNISLTIDKGECFGLLGVNGAGKTTTFNMMTGDLAATSGDGYLYSYNVSRQLRKAQKYMGYCPQFDALIGNMTGRELLTMFANLRGIPEEAISNSVEEVVTIFNLEDHADKECGSYSGGNKRKLSTGIAIIGSPPLIFLDEPTSGMDPTARRFLWDVLCFLREEGCSIVLTSHSMEECEALCTRLVIMVNGSNRCLGSIQQLKTTYSQGYTVCLVMNPDSQLLCQSFVEDHFPDAIKKDSHHGYLVYSLGTAYKWSYIFDLMERNKEALGLLDYSVSQSSLEQVFLNFAKDQIPDKEKKKFTEKIAALCCCKKKKTQVEVVKYNADTDYVNPQFNDACFGATSSGKLV